MIPATDGEHDQRAATRVTTKVTTDGSGDVLSRDGRERPILFSGPMVRALLAGRKTQTRRIAKEFTDEHEAILRRHPNQKGCRYGEPGDRLWVREAWRLHERFSDVARIVYSASKHTSWTEMHEDFPADLVGKLQPSTGFKPSIHMPRWASRLTLEITEVRVERLQDISEADAIAEGCLGALGPNPDFPDEWDPSPQEEYRDLWNTINGPRAWDANPWVWAVSFRVAKA